jgi:predicted sulfurtransferase
MRLFLMPLICFVLAIGIACNQAAAPTITKVEPTKQPASIPKTDEHDHGNEDNVARISLEDAKKAFDAGTAVFVDTRDISSYNFNRIKGAINLPMNEYATGWQKIPKGKKIIAYCS